MGKPAKPLSSVNKQPPVGMNAPQTGFNPIQDATPKAPSRLVMPDANQPSQAVPQQNFSQPTQMPSQSMPSQPLPNQAMPPQNYQQAAPTAVPPSQVNIFLSFLNIIEFNQLHELRINVFCDYE